MRKKRLLAPVIGICLPCVQTASTHKVDPSLHSVLYFPVVIIEYRQAPQRPPVVFRMQYAF